MNAEKFLNSDRLYELWSKIKEGFSGKQDKLTGQPGQLAGFNQAGALSPQYLNFQVLGDGNPVGAVISFLGVTAPQGYLVCDGSQYAVEDYPELAGFFESQFGAKNYFGGDGETTFAVPDMRNLFLRGYHGDSEEQLSGEIGQMQDATNHLHFVADGAHGNIGIFANERMEVSEPDTIDMNKIPVRFGNLPNQNDIDCLGKTYTSRPVNMAVLYCIKAEEQSFFSGNEYSLEQKRIGTWIDGRPIYRRVVEFTLPNNQAGGNIPVYDFGIRIQVVRFEGFLHQHNARGFYNTVQSLPSTHGLDLTYYAGILFTDLNDTTTNIIIHMGRGDVMQGAPAYVIVDYTKTTD